MRSVALRAIALVQLSLLIGGCSFSFSTAHITSFAISRDKEGTQPAADFAPNEHIYATVAVGNAPAKVTLKWRLIAEHVPGLGDHAPLPEADTDFELAGSGTSTYTLRPPRDGWPAGTYTIRVGMHDDSGAEKDQRSGTFSIAGPPSAYSGAAAAGLQ